MVIQTHIHKRTMTLIPKIGDKSEVDVTSEADWKQEAEGLLPNGIAVGWRKRKQKRDRSGTSM